MLFCSSLESLIVVGDLWVCLCLFLIFSLLCIRFLLCCIDCPIWVVLFVVLGCFCIWVRDFSVSYVGLRLSADYYVGVPLFGCWSLSVCDLLHFRLFRVFCL